MAEIIYIDSNDGQIIKGNVYTNDTRTAELFNQIGIAHIPEKDTEGVLTYIGNGKGNGIIIASKNRNAPAPSEAGESIIYSMKSGTIKAKAVFTTAGNIELNGNSKSFVTHTELDTALQTFMIALNAHMHPTAATGPPSPPTPMTMDISSSATTTIKTGG